MRVGIFYSSFAFAPNKVLLMDCFKSGVRANGDIAVDYKTEGQSIKDIDAAFILGYSVEKNYRRRIIDTCKERNILPIYVDSNIFVYGTTNTFFYHRYSVNGIFMNDGEYELGRAIDSERTKKILAYHKINIKPWRTNGDYIIILGQRRKSWNFGEKDGLEWIINTIAKIRLHTDRKILVRLHPGDLKSNSSSRSILQEKFGNSIIISKEANIKKDLAKAWCSVGFNSTPNCVSAMEGVPVFVDDPDRCWAKDIAFTDLSLIENPPMPERDKWLDNLALIHWNNEEIKNGIYWKFFKKFYGKE